MWELEKLKDLARPALEYHEFVKAAYIAALELHFFLPRKL